MANKRMISADLFEDDYICSLDYLFRFTWIGIIVACADDQGRFLDNPAIIRSKVFSLDNEIKDDQIEAMISEFASAGKIVRYQNANKRLIQIVNWWKYQAPSWASPSKYPAPAGWVDRVKYHKLNNKIEVINWDQEGGFQKIHSSLPTPVDPDTETDECNQEHTELHSQLPTELPTQIDSAIDEMRRDEMRRDEMSRVKNEPFLPSKKPSKKPIDKIPKENTKKSYGEFKNVTLTDDEYKKLQERFPSCYSDWIEKLSFWKESKGKRTKSDYATILNWDRMNKDKNPEVKNQMEGWILR